MNEAAWCYLEGFGCKKDKVRCFFVATVNCPIIYPGDTEKNQRMEAHIAAFKSGWHACRMTICSSSGV